MNFTSKKEIENYIRQMSVEQLWHELSFDALETTILYNFRDTNVDYEILRKTVQETVGFFRIVGRYYINRLDYIIIKAMIDAAPTSFDTLSPQEFQRAIVTESYEKSILENMDQTVDYVFGDRFTMTFTDFLCENL